MGDNLTRKQAPDRSKINMHQPHEVRGRDEVGMEFVKGTLLWLVGIPLPIILLIALFMHPS
jgi:hypothetical protein